MKTRSGSGSRRNQKTLTNFKKLDEFYEIKKVKIQSNRRNRKTLTNFKKRDKSYENRCRNFCVVLVDIAVKPEWRDYVLPYLDEDGKSLEEESSSKFVRSQFTKSMPLFPSCTTKIDTVLCESEPLNATEVIEKNAEILVNTVLTSPSDNSDWTLQISDSENEIVKRTDLIRVNESVSNVPNASPKLELDNICKSNLNDSVSSTSDNGNLNNEYYQPRESVNCSDASLEIIGASFEDVTIECTTPLKHLQSVSIKDSNATLITAKDVSNDHFYFDKPDTLNLSQIPVCFGDTPLCLESVSLTTSENIDNGNDKPDVNREDTSNRDPLTGKLVSNENKSSGSDITTFDCEEDESNLSELLFGSDSDILNESSATTSETSILEGIVENSQSDGKVTNNEPTSGQTISPSKPTTESTILRCAKSVPSLDDWVLETVVDIFENTSDECRPREHGITTIHSPRKVVSNSPCGNEDIDTTTDIINNHKCTSNFESNIVSKCSTNQLNLSSTSEASISNLNDMHSFTASEQPSAKMIKCLKRPSSKFGSDKTNYEKKSKTLPVLDNDHLTHDVDVVELGIQDLPVHTSKGLSNADACRINSVERGMYLPIETNTVLHKTYPKHKINLATRGSSNNVNCENLDKSAESSHINVADHISNSEYDVVIPENVPDLGNEGSSDTPTEPASGDVTNLENVKNSVKNGCTESENHVIKIKSASSTHLVNEKTPKRRIEAPALNRNMTKMGQNTEDNPSVCFSPELDESHLQDLIRRIIHNLDIEQGKDSLLTENIAVVNSNTIENGDVHEVVSNTSEKEKETCDDTSAAVEELNKNKQSTVLRISRRLDHEGNIIYSLKDGKIKLISKSQNVDPSLPSNEATSTLQSASGVEEVIESSTIVNTIATPYKFKNKLPYGQSTNPFWIRKRSVKKSQKSRLKIVSTDAESDQEDDVYSFRDNERENDVASGIGKSSITGLKDVEPIKCWKCGTLSECERRFGMHFYSLHLDSTVMQCLYCPREFYYDQADAFKRHYIQHLRQKEESMRKKIIENIYAGIGDVGAYMKIYSAAGSVFCCLKCNYRTETSEIIEMHVQNVHHVAVDDKQKKFRIACKYCDKRFDSSASVRIHCLKEHRKKLSMCKYCFWMGTEQGVQRHIKSCSLYAMNENTNVPEDVKQQESDLWWAALSITKDWLHSHNGYLARPRKELAEVRLHSYNVSL